MSPHPEGTGPADQPGWFRPGLANHLLTPAYDAVTELFGFGRRFKRTIAARIDIGPGAVSYTHLTLPTNREV